MKKKKMVLKILLVIVLIALSATGMFVYQKSKYDKIIEVKDQITLGLQEELTEILNRPKRSIVVFNKEMNQGKEITEDDLMTLLIEETVSPANAISDKSEVIGKRVKINALMYQYLTDSLIYADEDIPDDLREKEYTYLNVPEKLEAGDTVDLRIKFPSGQDYVVLSKKLVTDIVRLYNDGNELTKETVWINQGEDETVRMGSAIVDAYLNGAELYLIEYVDPYIQEAAQITYPKNFPVLDMIALNPNLLDVAEKELESRKELEESISEVVENKVNFATPTINTNINNGSTNTITETTPPVQQQPTVSEPAATEQAPATNQDSGESSFN